MKIGSAHYALQAWRGKLTLAWCCGVALLALGPACGSSTGTHGNALDSGVDSSGRRDAELPDVRADQSSDGSDGSSDASYWNPPPDGTHYASPGRRRRWEHRPSLSDC